MDIDCCRNVRVSNCSVNSPWDDGICLKSSFALGYARATEMVTISNCLRDRQLPGRHAARRDLQAFSRRKIKPARTGRIKFGTESNGGFKNITVSNCVFEGCHGFAIESVDGAVIEDVSITNITMRDILGRSDLRAPRRSHARTCRRSRRRDSPPRSSATSLASSAGPERICSIISGIPGHPIEDVKLSDITILHPGGGTAADAALQLAEKEKDYPEPTMFGTTPAHGFFLRHVKGIEMSGIKIESASPGCAPRLRSP